MAKTPTANVDRTAVIARSFMCGHKPETGGIVRGYKVLARILSNITRFYMQLAGI